MTCDDKSCIEARAWGARKIAELEAEVERLTAKQTGLATCPFCDDTNFDLIGLRHHLMVIECEQFVQTPTVEEERRLRAALAATPPETATAQGDRIYPCDRCGKMRTKDEGGTVFTVCDECWETLPIPPKGGDDDGASR